MVRSGVTIAIACRHQLAEAVSRAGDMLESEYAGIPKDLPGKPVEIGRIGGRLFLHRTGRYLRQFVELRFERRQMDVTNFLDILCRLVHSVTEQHSVRICDRLGEPVLGHELADLAHSATFIGLNISSICD